MVFLDPRLDVADSTYDSKSLRTVHTSSWRFTAMTQILLLFLSGPTTPVTNDLRGCPRRNLGELWLQLTPQTCWLPLLFCSLSLLAPVSSLCGGGIRGSLPLSATSAPPEPGRRIGNCTSFDSSGQHCGATPLRYLIQSWFQKASPSYPDRRVVILRQ